MTVLLTFASAVFSMLLSFILGLAKVSKFALIRIPASTFVEFFRGTSLLVQMFWLYFVLPQIFQKLSIDIPFNAVWIGIAAISINYGAYGAEIVRSSILAVNKGQTEASIALNMTPVQRMRFVIIPQAFLRMLPPFGNLLIELLKSTPLVSFITLNDLMNVTETLQSTYNQHTPALMITILFIYFIIAYAFTLGMRAIERKASKGRL